MIPLVQAVDDYVAMRRALGYQLTEHGRVLPQFARFLDAARRTADHDRLGAGVRDAPG